MTDLGAESIGKLPNDIYPSILVTDILKTILLQFLIYYMST